MDRDPQADAVRLGQAGVPPCHGLLHRTAQRTASTTLANSTMRRRRSTSSRAPCGPWRDDRRLGAGGARASFLVSTSSGTCPTPSVTRMADASGRDCPPQPCGSPPCLGPTGCANASSAERLRASRAADAAREASGGTGRQRWLAPPDAGLGRPARSGSIRTEGPPDRARGHRREPLGGVAGDLEPGLAVGDADRADLLLGDVAAAADQRDQPARVGVAGAADVHPEPDHVAVARAARALPSRSRAGGGSGACLDQLLRLGQLGPVAADQGGGDRLGVAPGEQRPGGCELVRRQLGRGRQLGQQPLAGPWPGSPRPRAAATRRRAGWRRSAAARPGGAGCRARSAPTRPCGRRGRCGRCGAAAPRGRAAGRRG